MRFFKSGLSCIFLLVFLLFLFPLMDSTPSLGSGPLKPKGGPSDGLTVRRLFESPKLDGPSLRGLKLLPDGKRVLYLKEKKSDLLRLDLWVYDREKKQHRVLVDSDFLSSGKAGALPEVLGSDEKARRERKRISESGIVEYFVSKNGRVLVFSLSGSLFSLDLSLRESLPRRLTKESDGKSADETFLQLSPLGTYLSFVRGSNLFWIECASGKETQVTFDGTPLIRYGVPEFIAQEEMNRMEAQYWSPDETVLAFTKTDETDVGILKRLEILPSGPEVVEQRYPKAGGNNARVQLGFVRVSEPKKVFWIDSSHGAGGVTGPGWEYLARVNWLPDSKVLSYQTQNRDQKNLDLHLYPLIEGKKQTILREESPHWINLHSDLHFLKNQAAFVWSSERSGQRQAYLYQLDGTLLRSLTESPVQVARILEVDEASGWVYFEGSDGIPEERHLFRVSLQKGSPEKLTQEPGWHQLSLSVSSAAVTYVDTFSSLKTPPQVSIRSVGTGGSREIEWLEQNELNSSHPVSSYWSGFVETRLQTLHTRDGRSLSALVTKPKKATGKSRVQVPLIVIVYGGPGVQLVANQWGGRYFLLSQIFAQLGFGVLTVDGRGSWGRGFAFQSPISGQLGQYEVEDQKAAVQTLLQEGWVDPKRVGVMGWSYGGYMTLMMLLKEPQLFKVGVAGAPVTDWALYDSHYTERYLGTPVAHAAGYSASSILSVAKHLKGRLLVIHGMADDNVFFNHSLELFKLLQSEMLPFDTMVYPGGKHGISGKTSQTHVYEKTVEYFKLNL